MLFRRPFLLLLLAAFVPLAALSVVLGIAALRAEQDKIERDAVERVRLLAGELAHDLTSQLDVLRVLAQSRDFDNGTTQADFSDLARRVKQEVTAWLAMRFTDRDGMIVADAPLGIAGASGGRIVELDSHRLAVESRQPVVGPVARGSGGRYAFALRVPVIRDDKVIYVLSAVLAPDFIRERFLAPGLPEHWVATVIDGAGNIVARSAGPADLVGERASAAARTARETGSEGIYSGYLLEGVPTMSVFRRLPVGNWSVHVGVPRDIFMAPVQQSLWIIGLGLLATLLLAVTFLWLLVREIKLKRQEELGMDSMRRLEALGHMTGGVAHDFNNLLMIVQGGAEGIKRRAGDPDRQRGYADAILAAVQRGQALTRQLLGFAQRSAHDPVSFRMQERAAELKDLLSRSVQQNVEVHISVPSDTWPVRADPNALEVALINLAVNASDAMPEGGRISISAFNISMHKGREGNPGLEGNFVAIAVTDTGTGIAAEHIDRIFEPFFTTKARGKGTGLGLSQVYGFAQQSGGAVTVRGRPGQGSTFTVFLPRALEAEPPPRARPKARSGPNNGRILLVEDTPGVADVTTAMLSDAGYQVSRSSSASAALEILNAGQKFDVILSDIVMEEGISGLDLARRVRATWPALPIVLMTGYSEALTGEDLAELPVVFKPFAQEDMLEALALIRSGEWRATLD